MRKNLFKIKHLPRVDLLTVQDVFQGNIKSIFIDLYHSAHPAGVLQNAPTRETLSGLVFIDCKSRGVLQNARKSLISGHKSGLCQINIVADAPLKGANKSA
ncbi:MAG: hypothetical protein ACI3X6_07910 [Alloprevotella sp.]